MANEKFSDLSAVTQLNAAYLFCVADPGVDNYKITAANIVDNSNVVLTSGKIALSSAVSLPGTLQLGGHMNADGYDITDVVALIGATGTPSYLRTNIADTDSIVVQAYDVDGASYVSFITLTAGNTPTCNLSDSVTKNGQYIYRVGGLDVAAGDGGTGISTYDVGDILYASGVTTLSKLSAVATGNALISGGVATAPSWGKIGLTTHVSGTLPTANGGTGQTTYTAGQLLIGKNDGTLAKSTLTAGTGISISNGDGTITITNTGAAGDVTGIIGTANQILANGTSGSSQEGEVTLTLASTIQTGGGTFTTGGTLYGLSNTPTLTLGTQNSLAGVIKLLGVDASAYSILQSTTVNLHIDSPNTASSHIYLNNYATTAVGTIIQPNGGQTSIGGGLITGAALGITGGSVAGTDRYGVYIVAPTAGTNRYGLAVETATGGTVNVATYTANLSVGYTGFTPPSNGAIINGKVILGATTLQADSLTNDLQLGIAGTTKGFSIAMSNVYIRLREVGIANQLCLSANWATGSQDSGTYNSWLFNMYCAATNDTISIQRSPAGSTSLSTFWILRGTGEMQTGKIWNGYISSTSNVESGTRYDALADGSTIGYNSSAFGTTGFGNSSGFYARHARGTQASPTATQSGDLMGAVGGRAYNGSAFNTGGYISFSANENWSGSNNGTTIGFFANEKGQNAASQVAIIDDNNFVMGTGAAISTSATKRFLYITSCAGIPSGTPVSYTGSIPMVYDSTNNRLYLYNGSWRYATLT